MIDVEKIRQDFPMIRNHPELIYFDNGATTFKPQCVIDAVTAFYTHGTSNVHRGDYEIAVQADRHYDASRRSIARLLNCDPKEVAFTAGDTAALNQIAYGMGRNFLKSGDTILTTEAEHASNLLPWYRLEKEYGIHVEYIPVDRQGVCHMEDVEQAWHEGVRAVAMAQVTNVLGSLQPVKEIAAYAHRHGAYMIVDGAQSVPHRPTDVRDLDIDFLAFSSHKMCGPDGVGVLYGKYELLQKMDPVFLGGGMNARFQSCGEMLLKEAPEKFEAGTPNIEGVIGLGAAAEYLMSIGLDNIMEYERDLRAYFASEIKKLDHLEFYNPDNETGPVAFNAKGIFAQDAAGYLASRNVAVRSGNHCAKILHEIIGTDQTIRASLYFYNTKEEVDRFIEAAKDISIENAISILL
ncbi:MAG: cysteine desulfurase [Solobacterium sp.]|nr:cysteine desulfurase [Erysipelotrichaceae bacterium]MBQ9154651.1 cysteine desulfurase [Solobacterium sp.]